MSNNKIFEETIVRDSSGKIISSSSNVSTSSFYTDENINNDIMGTKTLNNGCTIEKVIKKIYGNGDNVGKESTWTLKTDLGGTNTLTYDGPNQELSTRYGKTGMIKRPTIYINAEDLTYDNVKKSSSSNVYNTNISGNSLSEKIDKTVSMSERLAGTESSAGSEPIVIDSSLTGITGIQFNDLDE